MDFLQYAWRYLSKAPIPSFALGALLSFAQYKNFISAEDTAWPTILVLLLLGVLAALGLKNIMNKPLTKTLNRHIRGLCAGFMFIFLWSTELSSVHMLFFVIANTMTLYNDYPFSE